MPSSYSRIASVFATEFFQEHGKFDQCVGMVRFKFQGLGVAGHGGLVLSQRLLGHAQVRHRLGILRVDFQRAAKRVQGLRESPQRVKGEAVVIPIDGVLGVHSMARPMSSIAAS